MMMRSMLLSPNKLSLQHKNEKERILRKIKTFKIYKNSYL